jgi:hypothetical protein
MTEQTAESTPNDAKPERQTDPAALKLLGNWRTKATPLYLIAKLNSALVICAKVLIAELVRDGEDGFLLYLSDPNFDDEHEPPSQYQPTRIGFSHLWRLRLSELEATYSGTTVVLTGSGTRIELSENRPATPGDSYYGGRIERWWA